MPAPDDAADRALLERAARAAGEIAGRFFKRDPRVWDKGDQGPVTEADLAIDAMLRETLTAARPDYGWLSEESMPEGRTPGTRVFVIDPIDGTRAFIEGNPDFTHSLAVVEAGAPVAAAIHQPERDRTWTAHRGGGASLDGAPLTPSPRAELDGARVLTAKPTLRPELWRAPPGFERAFRSSLAYRLALVAEGRFDAMLTLRDCWEWDIAAGALICAEAGATVTDRAGRPLRFDGPDALLPGTVAAPPVLHAALLDRLAPPG